MTYWSPALFDFEDRGYNRGVGELVTPNGRIIALGQECDELAEVFAREVWSLYLNGADDA